MALLGIILQGANFYLKVGGGSKNSGNADTLELLYWGGGGGVQWSPSTFL